MLFIAEDKKDANNRRKKKARNRLILQPAQELCRNCTNRKNIAARHTYYHKGRRNQTTEA